MRDTVVYVGGFSLPDRSASALRALGNACVLREAGYRVVIAGKFAEVPDPQRQPVLVRDFPAYDIRQPLPGLGRVDYTISPRNLRALLLHLGLQRIAGIMAYNYPGIGLHRLIGLGREYRVPIINESTEWYGWEGFRPVSNARRIMESRWRNTSLVNSAGNLVCASRWLQARHPNVNSLVLPFALEPEWDCWRSEPDYSWCGDADAVRLVYSGSPGLGMHKDRLPLIVDALASVDPAGERFRFAVVGITLKEYLASVPRHADLLGRLERSIRFLGRVPHRKAVGVLRSGDVSVFVRERNRVSEVGFPTKYAEAATCGIPVMTNRTSDIADYLVDGDNGFLLPDCSPSHLKDGLRRAVALGQPGLAAMKMRASKKNPFAVRLWVPKMREFMSQLRVVQ